MEIKHSEGELGRVLWPDFGKSGIDSMRSNGSKAPTLMNLPRGLDEDFKIASSDLSEKDKTLLAGAFWETVKGVLEKIGISILGPPGEIGEGAEKLCLPFSTLIGTL